MSLVEIENLRISFPTEDGMVDAVRGIDLSLGRERLGIVGESGSGKSLTGRALMGVLPDHARMSVDRMEFDGIDLVRAGARTRRKLRGGRMGMILQDPKFSLNPVMTIGRQIVEAYSRRGDATKSDARNRAIAMLEAVQIRDAGRVFNAYPHELSGGMGQRAMIAMMLIAEPDLLIADEPT